MAYVPPARREKTQQLTGDNASKVTGTNTDPLNEPSGDSALLKLDTNPTFRHADIHDYYWAPPPTDGVDKPPTTFVAAMHHGTLNSSSLNHDKLKYVMLFKDANPRWDSDGIIFVKSSLQLLPGGERFKDNEDSRETSTQVLALLENGIAQTVVEQRERIAEGAVKTQQPGDKQRADEDVTENQVSCDNMASVEELKASGAGEVNHVDSMDADSHDGTPTHDCLSNNGTCIDHTTKPKSEEKEDPTAETTLTPNLSHYDTGSIAVFEQTGKRQTGPFRFSGYYKITRLQYLAPQSAELYRMLEQKFSTVDRFGRVKQRQRSAASWEASMSFTWAVVKIEEDDEANINMPPPRIEVKDVAGEGENSPKRTVNELLDLMRLKD